MNPTAHMKHRTLPNRESRAITPDEREDKPKSRGDEIPAPVHFGPG